MDDKQNNSERPPESAIARKSPTQQDDQQSQERLRIAERLVRDLRGAGYSCDVVDGGQVRPLMDS